MTRQFTDTLNTYLAGDSLLTAILLEIDVIDSAGTVSTNYFTDNAFDIFFSGNTYLAQGEFLSFTESQESGDLNISNVNIAISALDVSLVRTYAVSSQINAGVRIYRAFLDPNTRFLLGDSGDDALVLLFKGKVAGYSVTNNQTTADIQYQVSSQFVNFNKKNGRRSNLQNFQREHPSDFGMEYSHETLSELKWGLK
ncbi:MAG: putative baseplate hub protein [Prokaryotic dsDNA virus sp.]|jgi:hypothetical protein|nr:MAG: putative baseplate hub protein [Prokaryotic dsDNA virus sp.]|tara:strand:+ start:2022 stop:2612 length:591 start_codon:yes stop_codon:yes gene_type:complete